jgi:hypothetical protein
LLNATAVICNCATDASTIKTSVTHKRAGLYLNEVLCVFQQERVLEQA